MFQSNIQPWSYHFGQKVSGSWLSVYESDNEPQQFHSRWSTFESDVNPLYQPSWENSVYERDNSVYERDVEPEYLGSILLIRKFLVLRMFESNIKPLHTIHVGSTLYLRVIQAFVSTVVGIILSRRYLCTPYMKVISILCQ